MQTDPTTTAAPAEFAPDPGADGRRERIFNRDASFVADQLAEPELPRLLAPGEATELAECERIIERGLQTFYEVGLAMAKIRDRRLYREQALTWEQYCQDRWQIGARRAQQLCKAAETVRELAGTGANANPGFAFPMPASEKHVRPLYNLPEEERRAAWQEVVSKWPNGGVTRKRVEEVVQARRISLGLGAPVTAAAPQARISETKDQRIREATRRAIGDVRELIDLAGTADSSKSADLRLALEQLEGFHDHLKNLENMQRSRADQRRLTSAATMENRP